MRCSLSCSPIGAYWVGGSSREWQIDRDCRCGDKEEGERVGWLVGSRGGWMGH